MFELEWSLRAYRHMHTYMHSTCIATQTSLLLPHQIRRLQAPLNLISVIVLCTRKKLLHKQWCDMTSYLHNYVNAIHIHNDGLPSYM